MKESKNPNVEAGMKPMGRLKTLKISNGRIQRDIEP